MASSSALPTINNLLEYVSQLLQHSSQAEAEARSVALQCLELKGKIEQTKANVVEERMKQLVCTDEIAHLKKISVPRYSGSKRYVENTVHSRVLSLIRSLQYNCDSRRSRTKTSLEMRLYLQLQFVI